MGFVFLGRKHGRARHLVVPDKTVNILALAAEGGQAVAG